MIFMWHRPVAAIQAVLVFVCVRFAVVNSAIGRNNIAVCQNVLVDVTVVNVMQMPIVQIIRVRVVLHCGVPAVCTVSVVMAVMGLVHRF